MVCVALFMLIMLSAHLLAADWITLELRLITINGALLALAPDIL